MTIIMTMTSTRLQRRVSCNSNGVLVAVELQEVEGQVLIENRDPSVADEDLPHHFRAMNYQWVDVDGHREDFPSPPSARQS